MACTHDRPLHCRQMGRRVSVDFVIEGGHNLGPPLLPPHLRTGHPLAAVEQQRVGQRWIACLRLVVVRRVRRLGIAVSAMANRGDVQNVHHPLSILLGLLLVGRGCSRRLGNGRSSLRRSSSHDQQDGRQQQKPMGRRPNQQMTPPGSPASAAAGAFSTRRTRAVASGPRILISLMRSKAGRQIPHVTRFAGASSGWSLLRQNFDAGHRRVAFDRYELEQHLLLGVRCEAGEAAHDHVSALLPEVEVLQDGLAVAKNIEHVVRRFLLRGSLPLMDRPCREVERDAVLSRNDGERVREISPAARLE